MAISTTPKLETDPFFDANRNITYYSRSRRDRSGSTLHDMLLAHAYAFVHGANYGGACLPRMIAHWKGDAVRLLQALHLDPLLPFVLDCSGGKEEKGGSSRVVSWKVYRPPDASLFTNEWRERMRQWQESHRPPPSSNSSGKVLDIVLHMRRGDVEPCRRPMRYLPNAHYLKVLESYVPRTNQTNATPQRPYHITIFSQSDSYEGFGDFVEAYGAENVQLRLDTSLEEVWKGIIQADVFIMSQSSFSYVPALLNFDGTIVYTEFEHHPLPDWDVVPQPIYQASRALALSMQEAACIQSPHKRVGVWQRQIKPRLKRYVRYFLFGREAMDG